MTYHNAVKFITNSPAELPSPHPFERITKLCAKLGNPEKRIRYIRLAGSNGKTVCAEMLMSILKHSNVTAGCLYMPLRDDIRENIRIGSENFSIEDTAIYISKVYEAVNEIRREMCEENGGEPVEFTPTKSEILLATALLAFREKHCSLCIIEGDHNGDDPSKFLPSPFAAMICGTIPSVDRHEVLKIRSYITRGIQEIISAPQDMEAFRVISDTCATVNCRLSIPSKASMKVFSVTLGGSSFRYKDKDYTLNLCGRFQLSNAEVVLETAEMLIRKGYPLTEESIKKGLSTVKLKSKFEVLSISPTIIADSTHKAVAIGPICDSLTDFKAVTGERLYLCLPQGEIIDEYRKALLERGYTIEKIFTLGNAEAQGDIEYYKTPKALVKNALSPISKSRDRDCAIVISGTYNFTDKIRHELLSALGF